jgi:hypothetical protein
MIIHLTKVNFYGIMRYMEANCHPFLGLAEEADGRSDRRKSRLMLASNFLVGTFFKASRFSFGSNGELL